MLIVQALIYFVTLNLFALGIDSLFNKIFDKLEKRSQEKYSLYDWLGNPQSPISLEQKLTSIKDFSPKEFNKNCSEIKTIITSSLDTLEKLKSYRKYLELKTESPRLTALLNSFQTILIAIITATLITILSFSDVKSWIYLISAFVFIIFFIGLLKVIDWLSKNIDQNRLLLMLVNECIYEKEHESIPN